MIKQILRYIYYVFLGGSTVSMKGHHAAAGKKWLVDKRVGMAYFRGYYEPSLTRFISEILSPESVFVDAGAHAGYFSLIAASKAVRGSVFSFEPETINYNYICSIKKLNKLDSWIVENKALSSFPTVLKFRTSRFSSMGSVSDSGDTEVVATSLDAYFASNPIHRLDLIKIDVEGYGLSVLKGSLSTIARFSPYILMEVHRGSDEYAGAYSLLRETYEFYDFDTAQRLEGGNFTVDFILLAPACRLADKDNVLSLLKAFANSK